MSNLRVPKTIKLFINGEFPRTESGRTLPAFEHGTEVIYANLCRASRKDLRNAVTAAQGAQTSWQNRSAYNRGQILYRMAEMAEGKREEFCEMLTVTTGLKAEAAQAEVDAMIDGLVYYAGFTDKFQQMIGAVNPVAGPHHCFTTSEPVGLVAQIYDEDISLGALVAQMAAALAAGNVVVALLPERLGCLLAPLAEVMATSDLPKGVVNLLTGLRKELVEPLASHMEVQCLSYQGDDAGLLKQFQTAGAETMRRIVPEVREPLALDTLLSYVEYKTVWHPIGG